jgi:monoamine oxidase
VKVVILGGGIAGLVCAYEMAKAGFWGGTMFEESFDQQMPMFQPAGGMDRIPFAFAKTTGQDHPVSFGGEGDS